MKASNLEPPRDKMGLLGLVFWVVGALACIGFWVVATSALLQWLTRIGL